jgi:transglutaminase/protease-like cytokinesis protein 3
LCKLANIRVKTISGFAKGYGYKIGSQFSLTQEPNHAWNAVHIFGNWYLIDVTWSSGYSDDYRNFVKRLDEHYFLTCPEHLIWTHFPYDANDNNYNRYRNLSYDN